MQRHEEIVHTSSTLRLEDTQMFSYPFYKIHGQGDDLEQIWDWLLQLTKFYSDCTKKMK